MNISDLRQKKPIAAFGPPPIRTVRRSADRLLDQRAGMTLIFSLALPDAEMREGRPGATIGRKVSYKPKITNRPAITRSSNLFLAWAFRVSASSVCEIGNLKNC